MENKEVLDYVKGQIDKKVPREQITTNLLSQGWTQEDINAVFFKIGNPNFQPKQEEQKPSNLTAEKSIDIIKRSNFIKAIAIIQIIYTLTTVVFLLIAPSNPFFRYGTYVDIAATSATITLYTKSIKWYRWARSVLLVLFFLRLFAILYILFLTYVS